jgi:hypothetical protein
VGDQTTMLDKAIHVKKGLTRNHLHRYDLRIKVKATKTEVEEFTALQQAFMKFFDICLQADQLSIIPPYFELDRKDKTVLDLSSKFSVSELDSTALLKRYFSRLSAWNDKGNVYCSLILGQNVSFHEFMDKARLALTKLDYGLFPKACDHEETSDVGWLLYSTHQQDEERMSEMISKLVNKNVGVKWRPIHYNDRSHKEPGDNPPRTYALHLEASTNKAVDIRLKLSQWYGSSSRSFPDGTKSRLVPPFQTMLSFSH